MRLLPNYFKTLGEGLVRERMPIMSINSLNLLCVGDVGISLAFAVLFYHIITAFMFS